tara:strand:+ start:2369 stop:3592 length:1224 start_codon:yes stop_codon:yes gene_type:complete
MKKDKLMIIDTTPLYFTGNIKWYKSIVTSLIIYIYALITPLYAVSSEELTFISSEERSGKVQTVLGLVEPESLGITITHEHLIADGSAVWFSEPEGEIEMKMAYEPVSMKNLWWVRFNRFSNLDNFRLTEEREAIKEAIMFKEAGGGTIVDLTTNGHGRDPVKLKHVGQATGVNVIMATGWYIAASHPDELSKMSEQEMTERMVRDITVGVGNTGIRAGIIGEIGCSVPLHDTERRILHAAVAAQRQTGAPLNIHPSPIEKGLLENIQILENAGADPGRTIISHVDGGGFKIDTLKKLAKAGYYLEFDTFGYVHWMRTKAWNTFLPNDAQRIEQIMELIADGYLEKILISHDIYFKDVRSAYGGHGTSHILRNIVPAMRAKGITEEQIHKILVENPKRILTFVPPEG